MKKTSIFATILAGSALAFAGFGCSHNDRDTTAPNQYSTPAAPATVNPDMNQGGMEPGVGSGVNQRQNVNGTEKSGVSTPNDNVGGPIQQQNNLPANPDMNQGTHSMPNGGSTPSGTTGGTTGTPVK